MEIEDDNWEICYFTLTSLEKLLSSYNPEFISSPQLNKVRKFFKNSG
jgi:hypothetical protein